MRISLLFMPALLVCCQLAGQPTGSFKPFVIDTTLNSKLAKAKLQSEFDLPMIDNGFWFLTDANDFKEFSGSTDPAIFLDTLQTYSDVVCDCMMNGDTIYLQGGIGYVGSIAFDVRIAGNLFNGRIALAGKGFRTDQSAEFIKEIYLNSVNQQLKIQSRDSLQFEKQTTGEFILETENYYEKGEPQPNKLYMKVLFRCKLDDVIVI